MAHDEPAYESFEGFLRTAIKRYWDTKGSKLNFLALLLASREAWNVAWDEATSAPRRVVTGAASAATVAVLLRNFAAGPVGVLLTGASIASLVTVYARNHERIRGRVQRYRELIDRYRSRYKELRDQYVEGDVDRPQRNLMIDGLLNRFLGDLDATGPGAHPGSTEDFASHVTRRRREEEDENDSSERGDGRP